MEKNNGLLSANCPPNFSVRKFARTDRRTWVEAAEEFLVRRDIDGLRVSELANSLGVSRPSFYYHFESREDLIEEVIRHCFLKKTRLISSNLTKYRSLSSGMLSLISSWLLLSAHDLKIAYCIDNFRKTYPNSGLATRDLKEAAIFFAEKFLLRFDFEPTEARIRAENIVSFDVEGLQESFNKHEKLGEELSWVRAQGVILTGIQPDSVSVREFLLRQNMSKKPNRERDRGQAEQGGKFPSRLAS